MHDTLRYIEHAPIHRAYHHDDITFGLLYAFSERFILPISHDEVVHGKGSLLAKMPGDTWQRFANLRAYLGFMWAHPGKKLLFMGCEIAQPREWNHDAELDWGLLGDPAHAGIQRLVRDLNRIYAAEPALHRRDAEPEGFRWLIGDDRANSVFGFVRQGREGDAPVLVVCNMTPAPRHHYRHEGNSGLQTLAFLLQSPLAKRRCSTRFARPFYTGMSGFVPAHAPGCVLDHRRLRGRPARHPLAVK